MEIPTVSDIINDPITNLAADYWASHKETKKYDPKIIKKVYESDIQINSKSRLQLLNFSGYLENYLWKYFDSSASREHILSIIYLINDKFSDCLTGIFDELTRDGEAKFAMFFNQILNIGDELTSFNNIHIRTSYINFLINYFQSLENPIVRKLGLRHLFLPIWKHLSPQRLQMELQLYPQLSKMWWTLNVTETAQIVESNENKAKRRKSGNNESKKMIPNQASGSTGKEGTFIPKLIQEFIDLSKLDTIDSDTHQYVETFLEFLIDLLSQLPTRRFLNTLLDDLHISVILKMSTIFHSGSSNYVKLLQKLENFIYFPFQDHTGKSLSYSDVVSLHYLRINKLQKILYTDYFETMKDIIFSSPGRLLDADTLRKHFIIFTTTELIDITKKLGILCNRDIMFITRKGIDDMDLDDEDGERIHEFIVNILILYLIPRTNHLEEINLLSLYPIEKTLWDADIIPISGMSSKTYREILPIPKLNLQYLTLYDYLLRNFQLYHLESSYNIREDIMDAIKRMGPREGLKGSIIFKGWARMALPISSMTMDEIGKPNLGQKAPSKVLSTITIDLSTCTKMVRNEWEELHEHDIVFLVSIRKPKSESYNIDEFDKERQELSKGKNPQVRKSEILTDEGVLDFPSLFGVKYIRGGEVIEYKDEDDVILNDPINPDNRSGRSGVKRKIRILLDPSQYHNDLTNGNDCYESFNLIVRRDSKTSNFKAVLETIRDIMNTELLGQALPNWLQEVFLGYGNPNAAHYKSLLSKNGETDSFDYADTFLDATHVIESFPQAKEIIFNGTIKVDITSKATDFTSLPPPPYKINISDDSLRIDSYEVSPSLTTSVFNNSFRRNNIRFTPKQIEVIRSGMNHGLTLVQGPPGTGKSDSCVQLVSNLYHNFPTQKIVIITHSNAALNDLFEKIMERNVDPRHLLRLGSGERELRDTLAVSGAKGSGRGQGQDFTKIGRVNWILNRRIELLAEVDKLVKSLDVSGDFGSTCELAEYFYQDHILPRISEYDIAIQNPLKTDLNVADIFPFVKYFCVDSNLFSGSKTEDIKVASACLNSIRDMFSELSDYRSFELLRSLRHRTDYLLMKQARIVAMTSTHAAIVRKHLIDIDFKFDSLIVEEAGQLLDVETLIPMLLQRESENHRLKRVVLIGDHMQLPPIIQNQSLQKFAKFDQSLFARLIRLRVPYVMLDKQGRARSEIASLYNWRYRLSDGNSLDNLSFSDKRFDVANPGFAHVFQLVNVPDFNGVGETTPTAFYYQNLGEAEYIVATYQYMRLLGYPASSISILTTYNGQKHLIEDIIAQRCKNPIFGLPGQISTVDKYQGQQNDFILLSLVRTKSNVGHLRDIRRLIVALSRAKFGLYIFCRQQVFADCFELSPAFRILLTKPTNLQLVIGESYPSRRLLSEKLSKESIYEVTNDENVDNPVTAMGLLVYQLVQQVQLQCADNN